MIGYIYLADRIQKYEEDFPNMFNNVILSLDDIQFTLIFTFFLYLYFRKKRRAFLIVTLAGYLPIFLGLLLNLQEGMKAGLLLLGLVVALVLSYKELESLEKEGMDAKGFLIPDVLDFVVLILFVIVWTIIKATY